MGRRPDSLGGKKKKQQRKKPPRGLGVAVRMLLLDQNCVLAPAGKVILLFSRCCGPTLCLPDVPFMPAGGARACRGVHAWATVTQRRAWCRRRGICAVNAWGGFGILGVGKARHPYCRVIG